MDTLAMVRPPAAAASGAAMAAASERFAVMLTVNGLARTLHVEPQMTLAEALRGPLHLTGTKIACNRGACSACTVWVEGLPVCSCLMLAIEADGHSVTTIEGLANGDTLHPVQEAFIAHDALQCGFCTPGLIMSCAALLERTPDPNVDDVKTAIGGHFCRCGVYPHVVAATLAAARARKAP
jgi:xanthine dehydrogenase YagT iron-sulfur-binding subunit